MCKRIILLISCILLFAAAAECATFESIRIINSSNLASYFNNDLGYLYESHGCLHFTPPDIYLLTKTIAPGTPLRIKKYSAGDNDLSFSSLKVPFLADITLNEKDVERHKQAFLTGPAEIIVYPALGRLFIIVNGSAYAQVKTLAGPPQDILQVFDIKTDGAIEWDFTLSTPTDAGNYTILGDTPHYISPTYYSSTVVPFGAWLVKNNGLWSYQENGKWYRLPAQISNDLNDPPEQRTFNYYDIIYDGQGRIQSARWGSHDFGKYALLWTKDGKNKYPELGYAAGELLYEQVILVKDLVHILTLPGEDELDYCIAQNRNFSFYKGLYELFGSNGERAPSGIGAAAINEDRLYNQLDLSAEDYKNIDARLLEAFDKYQNNRLPRNAEARQKTLGLVYYLKSNSAVIKKQAHWYEDLKKNWAFWRNLRVKLREDFSAMGILSLENRQNLLEKWLADRLEFKTIGPPSQAKNVSTLSFAAFFRPDEESAVFSAREEAVMRKLISEATGEIEGLNLFSVKALNDYNFGVLLNDILGDLYKSHGCLHVSPRNMLLLYRLLPLKAQINIHDYSKKYDVSQIKNLPDLAGMVNFQDDLDKLKEKFTAASDVKIVVYPASGFWIICLKDKPFAKMQVKGGPQTKMYLVQ
ncbi:MAG: hypothetical protein QME05_06330, partial [Candidatus Margulisbacteria bacterium]|nr:hypothetical protein [Candidatus Margulisiibacteriota bacterium]